MECRMISQFLIAAPSSGSGKTTVSRGLMALLIKKGLKVQPFKCGPDYIDTKYHTAVCRRPSINLDTFMASAGHVKELYARYATGADACISPGLRGRRALQRGVTPSQKTYPVSVRQTVHSPTSA